MCRACQTIRHLPCPSLWQGRQSGAQPCLASGSSFWNRRNTYWGSLSEHARSQSVRSELMHLEADPRQSYRTKKRIARRTPDITPCIGWHQAFGTVLMATSSPQAVTVSLQVSGPVHFQLRLHFASRGVSIASAPALPGDWQQLLARCRTVWIAVDWK